MSRELYGIENRSSNLVSFDFLIVKHCMLKLIVFYFIFPFSFSRGINIDIVILRTGIRISYKRSPTNDTSIVGTTITDIKAQSPRLSMLIKIEKDEEDSCNQDRDQ